MSKSSGPVSVNVEAGTATATASRAHGVAHQPHESAECHRLKEFVNWKRWTAKSLWTPEQGFALVKDYDPDEFSQIQKISHRSQTDELYPFGGTEAHMLQDATHEAVLLGKLDVFHLKDKRDLTPLELFKEAQVKPAAFLEWAVELDWFKALGTELPEPLKPRPEAIEAQPALSPDAQPATDIEKEKILSAIECFLKKNPDLKTNAHMDLQALKLFTQGMTAGKVFKAIRPNEYIADPEGDVRRRKARAMKKLFPNPQ